MINLWKFLVMLAPLIEPYGLNRFQAIKMLSPIVMSAAGDHRIGEVPKANAVLISFFPYLFKNKKTAKESEK